MRKREEKELKHSGVEWVGGIPLSWGMVRAGFVFKHLKEIAKTDSYKYARLSLTMQGVLPKSKEDTKGLSPDNFDGYQIIKPDSLLFKLIDLANIATSRVGISSYEGIVSGAYVRLECSDSVMPKYAYYFYMDMYNRNIFNGLGSGVRSALNAKDLLKLSIPLPDLATQQRIVAFLDTETSKIDSLSEELTKFKTQLQTQRKSLISECVTKGVPVLINPTFIRTKLKYLSKVQSGSGFPNDMQGSMDYATPFLKVKSLKTSDDKGVISTYEDTVSDEIAKKLGATIIPAYSLIFAKVGEALKLNRFRIIANDSCIDNNMGALSFNSDVNARFMYYVMNLNDVKKFLNPGPIPSMNINRFMNSEIYIPPLGEQQKIADYLDVETAKIDALIGEIDNQVNLLKTYRKSLINEVVTGKVEV